MDTSNIGGDSGSASDSNPLPRQKPDFSAGLERLKGSLRAWKQLMDEGKVESLVVKIDTPAAETRMLSAEEQAQLQATKEQLSDHVQRILQTAPLK